MLGRLRIRATPLATPGLRGELMGELQKVPQSGTGGAPELLRPDHGASIPAASLPRSLTSCGSVVRPSSVPSG